MPFIETKTSVSVTKDQLRALKEMFAEVIEIIPGKSEETTAQLRVICINTCNRMERMEYQLLHS